MSERVRELRADTKSAQEFFAQLMAYTLGPVELKELMDKNKVRVVDVRRKEDFDIAHIPTAISMPADQLTDNLDKLSKEEISVVYCYNQQCHLGARACYKLAQYNYPVMHLDGGFKTWVEDFRFATEK